jgi:hypothetical protein
MEMSQWTPHFIQLIHTNKNERICVKFFYIKIHK